VCCGVFVTEQCVDGGEGEGAGLLPAALGTPAASVSMAEALFRRFLAIGHKSQVTSRKSQVTSHKSQVASRKSQVTSRKFPGDEGTLAGARSGWSGQGLLWAFAWEAAQLSVMEGSCTLGIPKEFLHLDTV